jgi:putative flippase GtrA
MKNLRPPAGPALLMRFGSVGIVATVIYAALASALMSEKWLSWSPVQASLVAYSAAALFSYFAHKAVTFMSRGQHRREAPRFLLLTATGLVVAYCTPALLTGFLGLPGIVPILITCIAIPVVNLIVLGRWVFAAGMTGR